MIAKTSLFSRGLIGSDLKRFWWVGALYGLFLVLILPLHHLMRLEQSLENKWAREALQRSLYVVTGNSELQVLLICIVPVVLAALLFRYLNTSRAVAMMHSLPCRRETLYTSHCIAGLILLVLPVLLTALVLAGLNLTTTLNECYSMLNILQWLGLTLLFNTLFFAVAVFVGMFTGNTIAHLVFNYIFHFLPIGLDLLVKYNLRELVWGYSDFNAGNTWLNYLPMMRLLEQSTRLGDISWGQITLYLGAAVLFFGVALYVYKVRQLETAGDVVSFPVFRPVFKYGVSICTMLLGGAYFGSMYQNTWPVITGGYLLGSLLGYWTAEMLLQKSFKVWAAYKGYLAYAATIAVLLAGLATDVTGYVHRIPDPGQVQKVYFGTNMFPWLYQEKLLAIPEDSRARYEGGYYFTEPDNIKNVVLLHHQLLQKPQVTKGPRNYVIYTLKNGEHLVRQYPVDENRYSSALKPVYESLEYKQGRFPVLSQNLEAIKLIEIKDERTPKAPVILVNRGEIAALTGLLRQEIRDLTFEELNARTTDYVNINITDVNGNSVPYKLRKSFSRVSGWLQDQGYYDQIILKPGEIIYVVLESEAQPGQNPGLRSHVEIRDREIIEELMYLEPSGKYKEYPQGEGYVFVRFFVQASSGLYDYSMNIPKDLTVSPGLKAYINQLN
ncbi:MAG: DUF6449 domain-containing protein [Heliobacteriaceae bacterium]|nr:DUF6449 domain-containing protein [Heliobacteriaceae bacterium]